MRQDNMKTLHDQWKQMDAKQKEPYERAAAADANRYRREVSPMYSTITFSHLFNSVNFENCGVPRLGTIAASSLRGT